MGWRLARSLDVLFDEVNDLAPRRSTLSDGTIGDPAHASRQSDHNPNSAGVVTAADITHDPGDGMDANDLAEHLRRLAKSGDRRVKYIIWNRRICSASSNWNWVRYSGVNPHDKHVHISVSSSSTHYDSTRSWGWKDRPELNAEDKEWIKNQLDAQRRDIMSKVREELGEERTVLLGEFSKVLNDEDKSGIIAAIRKDTRANRRTLRAIAWAVNGIATAVKSANVLTLPKDETGVNFNKKVVE